MQTKILFRSLALTFSFSALLQAEESISICWAKWDPSSLLEKLSQDFTKSTGIAVKMTQIPWENYEQVAFTNLSAKSDVWDILVGDSQWLGRSVREGHYVDLTDWVAKNGVEKNMTAATLKAYAEYPKNRERKYWAVPLEGDGIAFAYRTDLFADSANQQAYKALYGKDLAPPDTLGDLLNIARFFADPKQRKNPGPNQKFYGLAGYGASGAAGLTLTTEALIWNYGGSLGDPETYQVDGYLDRPGTIKGIETSRELFKLYPPGFSSAFYTEVNDAYNAGLVPMQINFVAFFPSLVTEGAKYAKTTGFFPFPGAMGPDGKLNQFTALGGQGASLVAYSKKQELARKWLDWFVQEDTQRKWARMGGFTCDKRVLASADFLDATPYNVTFAMTMGMVRDFWTVPEYPRLMNGMEDILAPYVTKGRGTAKQTAMKILEEHRKIFQAGGYYNKK